MNAMNIRADELFDRTSGASLSGRSAAMNAMNIRADEPFDRTSGTSLSGFDMAMAFCRLTSNLAARDRSSKPGKEAWCLSQILTAALENLPGGADVNLIDLGSGNGEKALQIVRAINGRGVQPVRYYPVDLSPCTALYAILTMLAAAGGIGRDEGTALLGTPPAPHILRALSVRPFPHEAIIKEIDRRRTSVEAIHRSNVIVPTRGIVFDFMDGLSQLMDTLSGLSIYRPGTKVFCLLGQTFGNYTKAARDSLLLELRCEMGVDDLLLIDGGLRPEEATIRQDDLDGRIANLVRFYRLGERFMSYKADCPGSSYGVAYCPRSHQVDYWFERPDGSHRELGFSHMWTARTFADELESAGFDILHCASSLDLADFRSGPETMALLARKGRTA